MQTERRVSANPQTKPTDLGCESVDKWLLPTTSTIAICYYYSYRPPDATASLSSLASLKSRLTWTIECWLIQVVLEKRPLNGSLFFLCVACKCWRFKCWPTYRAHTAVIAWPLRGHGFSCRLLRSLSGYSVQSTDSYSLCFSSYRLQVPDVL